MSSDVPIVCTSTSIYFEGYIVYKENPPVELVRAPPMPTPGEVGFVLQTTEKPPRCGTAVVG